MIDVERVREVADEVLRGPAYDEARTSALGRLLTEVRSWIAEQLFDLFSGSAAANVGLVVAVVVVVLAVGVGVIALLGVQRRAAVDLVVNEDVGTTPAQAEAGADAARSAGDLVTAVRRRYGALVLELIDRDVLPSLPGTTVGEVDAAVAARAPGCARAVIDAGDVLADIVYGHRDATTADDDVVATALRQVRTNVARRAVAV